MFIIGKIQVRSIIPVPLAGTMLAALSAPLLFFSAYGNGIMQNMTSWLQGNFSQVIKGNFEMEHL